MFKGFNVNLVNNILKTTIVLFFCLATYYFMTLPFGGGDEGHFYDNLKLVKNFGWQEAIAQKIGLTYIVLVYPFTFLLNDFIALRTVNVLILLALIFYFKTFAEIKNKMFIYYFLFFSCSGVFFIGTNDALFIASLVVFFNEAYKVLENKNKLSPVIMLCALVLALFTRQLVYIYLPAIVFFLFFIHQKKAIVISDLKIPLLLFIFLVIINIPSLQTNKNFSYDNKIPPKTVKASWSQRQYLAQLCVNSGKIPNESHPTWEQTDSYLQANGANSLPSGIVSGVLFDLKLTITEFFKDFGILFIRSARQTGLILITILFFLIYQVALKKISTNLVIPFCTLFMMLIFSFIIISFVEARWLIPMYTLALIYYGDLEYFKKINSKVFLFNNLFLILVIFYGSLKILNKI